MSRREVCSFNSKIDANVLHTAINLLKKDDWSPKQISGHLKRDGILISHETIYRVIRSDESGELRSHCRHKLKYRRHRKIIGKKTKVKNIPDRISIHDRPIEADGKRFGDWEMDTIVGRGKNSFILTLCERSTNFMLMTRLIHGKNAKNVAMAVTNLLLPYKKHVKTITTDNGSEFCCHKIIAKALGTTVYFADSYSSWQKGAIENTNKLIRQYITKSMNFNDLDDDFIKNVQYKINRRPREKLSFLSPKQVFFENIS